MLPLFPYQNAVDIPKTKQNKTITIWICLKDLQIFIIEQKLQ